MRAGIEGLSNGARPGGLKSFAQTAVTVSLLVTAAVGAAAQDLQLARIGDFRLDRGATIEDCVIGYRTAGVLAPDRSNVVLFPTWASGTSEQIVSSQLGPGKLVDTRTYYVIVLDALGNGVSSSPSNSPTQPRMRFPRFTIRDIVRAHHAAVTRVLGLSHVRAVVGVSMGAMQAFEWMVTFPGFMDAVVPIVGSPRLAPYDLLVWQAQIDAITRDAAWKGGEYAANPSQVADAEFGGLLLTTPDHYNAHTTRTEVREGLEKAALEDGFDANDKIRQAEAMMALDVSEPFGGSLERAAAVVHARVLVIVARTDHVVTPGPALEFARLLRAETVVLESDCGHLAPGCELARVSEAVARVLRTSP